MTPDKVEAALGVASQMRDELMFAYSHEMAICNVECADEYLHRAQALSVLTEALAEKDELLDMIRKQRDVFFAEQSRLAKELSERERDAARYFCDGPDGWFYTGTIDLARYLTRIVDPGGEDWTITDTQNPTGKEPPHDR